MLAQKLGIIRQEINKSIENSHLRASPPQILAASKGQGVETIEKAILAGITLFGENRVQEAYEKWPAIQQAHPAVKLHLIGPLQTNKVKQALGLFDCIQTLDRPRLAEEIKRVWGVGCGVSGDKPQKLNPDTRLFIQVNTGEEQQKAGVFPRDADDFIRYCKNELKLPVTGLMCIPPAGDVPAPHFALLRQIATSHGLNELSMGMSGDYAVAARMGSTIVRIGTKLFGERP
ncbi:MAG: YggS family pyridoxal phosphate-dependent enzyme [Alphaproteobacteria bacterium]